MTDFNKTLTPGDVKNGLVNVVIEMPAGSIDKIEWRRQVASFRLDRTNLTTFPVPVNYGFIPRTLNDDGDELDVLVISEKPIQTEVALTSKLIGVMKFEDEGETDDKIITIQSDDFNQKVYSVFDLPKSQIDEITNYFLHYKDYIRPDSTKVLGWADSEEAKKIIDRSIWLWDEQSVK